MRQRHRARYADGSSVPPFLLIATKHDIRMLNGIVVCSLQGYIVQKREKKAVAKEGEDDSMLVYDAHFQDNCCALAVAACMLADEDPEHTSPGLSHNAYTGTTSSTRSC